jgi:phage repressor protein C with HTH and peptisase S24 domain
VQLAAGAGQVPDAESKLPPLAFRKNWLNKKLVTSRKNLRIAGVTGDSMAPFIQDGDIVLIDVGQQDLQEMQVYAINYGGEVRIKRLARRFDGGLRIASDNPAYPEESLSPGEAEHVSILGRMLWRAG